MECLGVSVIRRNQPKGVKPKIRARQLSGIYPQEALKHTGMKQVGRTTKAVYSEGNLSQRFCPPQIPHDLAWNGTQTSTVTGQRLTA